MNVKKITKSIAMVFMLLTIVSCGSDSDTVDTGTTGVLSTQSGNTNIFTTQSGTFSNGTPFSTSTSYVPLTNVHNPSQKMNFFGDQKRFEIYQNFGGTIALGTWRTTANNTRTYVYLNDGSYYGQVISRTYSSRSCLEIISANSQIVGLFCRN